MARVAGIGVAVATFVAGGALLAPVEAAAVPLIAAHRGGTYVDGQPRFPENTMPAFRAAGRRGFIVELDVKLPATASPWCSTTPRWSG